MSNAQPPPNKTWSSSPLVERMILDFTGCSTLQDVTSLDLSKRKISTLDPAVFSKMVGLDSLNLSNNRISGFPINLGLRKLRVLNLHHNHLKSVATLEQFPDLEELNIENNLLSIADHYIAVYMLPKLKILNGKDVDIRETVQNMEDTLMAKVNEVWNENFLAELKEGMTKAEIRTLEESFIEMLNTQIQFGPDALVDFTNYMLTTLAEKHVTQQTSHLRKPLLEQPSIPVPNNKVQILIQDESGHTIQQTLDLGNGTTVASMVLENEEGAIQMEKRQAEEPPESAVLPEAKKAKGDPESASTSVAAPQTVSDPEQTETKTPEAQSKGTRGKKAAASSPAPKKAVKGKKKTEKSNRVQETEEKKDAPQVDGMQEVGVAYEPVHLLRCHSKEDDPNDTATNVWKCAFEPNPEQPGNSTWSVATCGSNIVCVVDCKTGIVLKKYQHNKEKEEFYCIAWTTLEMDVDGKKKATNILAAAGTKGTIKLLHPQQLLCYAEIKMERKSKPINCISFHPSHPTWLICGSEDIVIWDIGIPQGSDFKCKHKKLLNLSAPGRVLGLIAVPSADFLLAGCDNGCYGWNIDTNAFSKREKNHSLEILLPSKARLASAINEDGEDDEEKEGDMIDGLALLKDQLVASKVACDGSIHIWSLKEARSMKKGPVKEVTIKPVYSLEWCDSDSVYLDIGTWPGCGVLVSGDDQGEVWVYDVFKQAELAEAAGEKGPFKPNQLLPWPESKDEDKEEKEEEKSEEKDKEEQEDRIIVNDVSISSDCKYIVSVTNKNLVCVWQKA
ncbi:Leucine-rich repeat and WD repeat-containing protein 1 [Holothuria leucospilota]|uniref:Leucine-rich repeat and WD repeat-containing protein 1 n=1 Tax=Holothuria leucospilota TaxID=206669 RepID=A0A9Q1CD98_HOLLE|nr:Leucine-rich repeat and WD repeat-containing protein 1 [Holothuria leucospilota]